MQQVICVSLGTWFQSGSTLVGPRVTGCFCPGILAVASHSLKTCQVNWQLSPVAGHLSFVPLRWPSGDLWWQAPGGALPRCLETAGIQDSCDPLLCWGRIHRKHIDGGIKGNVDWSPLRLHYLYWSSVSNCSRFLFINIRPLLASLLITLLLGLTLRRSLIEWPEVTVPIDWVKITLTWVTHTVIKLGSDLFDAQSMDR